MRQKDTALIFFFTILHLFKHFTLVHSEQKCLKLFYAGFVEARKLNLRRAEINGAQTH